MTDRPALTARQREAYAFIVRFINAHEMAPTYAEIADALDARSVTTAVKLVDVLERKNYVRRTPDTARSLRLVDDGRDEPDRDDLAALTEIDPVHPDAEPNRTLWFDMRLMGRRPEPDSCSIVRIGDGGMGPAGIHVGDVVIVEPVDEDLLLNGDVIVCLMDRMAIARRIHQQSGGIRLTAADPDFSVVALREFGAAIRLLGRPLMAVRRL